MPAPCPNLGVDNQGCQDSGLTSELVASCSAHMLVGLLPPFLKWMEPLGVTALLFLGLQYSPMSARHLLSMFLQLRQYHVGLATEVRAEPPTVETQSGRLIEVERSVS